MENQKILERISNLKGRKNYEEKKALKLGFNSLYEYFEDKFLKEQKELEDKVNDFKERVIKNKSKKKQKPESLTNCKCC